MRISDNRYELDRRKHDLAKWMISHNARTSTVKQWTGLSEYRVQHLSRRYLAPRAKDRNGIPPSQTAYFAKSYELEVESLVFIFIAVEMRVIPEQIAPEARQVLPDLLRGERLMEAFECYRTLVRTPHISLERAILLVFEYSKRKNLTLKHCTHCQDLMLVESASQYDCCPFCRGGMSLDESLQRLSPELRIAANGPHVADTGVDTNRTRADADQVPAETTRIGNHLTPPATPKAPSSLEIFARTPSNGHRRIVRE